jgi:hypothetical protein
MGMAGDPDRMSFDVLELPQDTPLEKRALDEINVRLLWLGRQIKRAASSSSDSPFLIGTRAERLVQYPSTSYTAGQQFLETDTGLTYVNRQIGSGPGLAWYYLAGTVSVAYSSPLASHAAFVRGLTSQDAGLLVNVTDFAHVLQWTGTSWQRGPGDSEHSDTFHSFAAVPADAGWHECDGATVDYLKYDGTTGSRTLPDSKGTASYAKFGAAYSETIAAATLPVLTMASYTPAGTNSAPALTMNSYTPSGTNSSPVFFGSPLATHTHDAPVAFDGTTGLYTLLIPGFPGNAYVSTSKATTAVDATIHTSITTSYDSAGTPSGAVSAPFFTGSAATLTGTVAAPAFTGTPHVLTGTIALPGDPVKNFALILMYRI